MHKGQLLADLLKKRILVLDGAMGTLLQAAQLKDADFERPEYVGCNEWLSLSRPDVVKDVHNAYLEAGCDIVETNTFGATSIVLNEFNLAEQAEEINRVAASLAKDCADRFSTASAPRFVAGSMGPTTKTLHISPGGLVFKDFVASYKQQMRGLFLGGVDFFLIETTQDTSNAKAALCAYLELQREYPDLVPAALSCTIEPMGTMLAGQSIEAFYASMAHFPWLYIGMNCSTGPSKMTDPLRTLAGMSKFPVACMPNAGLPNEFGTYDENPAQMCEVFNRFIAEGWINLLGGCCGTTPTHIEAFAQLVKDKAPRVANPPRRSMLSGIDYLEVDDAGKPFFVGERTNVIGSRAFKNLIEQNEFELAADVGKKQVQSGAHAIDICLANPDRNEHEDMVAFLHIAGKKIRAPYLIDSTHPDVVRAALPLCQGKVLINSINLENGLEHFTQLIPDIKTFGAAVVVGTIDEDPKHGMAITLERKLEIAKRSHDILVHQSGLAPEDIYFDFLVFPCGTGDVNYMGSAKATIAAITEAKKLFPLCKSILGISNVSFGLPQAGREALNSVYLYLCVQAGLDLAIVNTQMLRRYASLKEEEIQLSQDILFKGEQNDIALFTKYFRKSKALASTSVTVVKSLEDRLSTYILEGTKDGLERDLREALTKYKPLEIINGPLMKGMDEVGRQFNANQLIVAEVLQSAESMKAAVAFLEPYMDKDSGALRGTVLLATVKGDVHDIGKNLVDIIFSNNGFKVIDLGIKVEPAVLIDAVKKHKPDILGLSGLLVKSAQQMVITAEELKNHQMDLPMLVGGAALSRNFVDRFIAPAYDAFVEYAPDAMKGLELAKKIVHPEQFVELVHETSSRQTVLQSQKVTPATPVNTPMISSEIKPAKLIPSVKSFDKQVINEIPLDIVFSYINPRMLYGRHLGIPGSVLKALENHGEAAVPSKFASIFEEVEKVKDYAKAYGLLNPKACYQFYKARSDKETIILSNQTYDIIATYTFPRQSKAPGLCLSDYLSPHSSDNDSIALFVVTAGTGVSQQASTWKNEGKYLWSHILSALALESAEGAAEWVHEKIREDWNLNPAKCDNKRDLFQAKYQGKRYSFGYPACPDLSGQKWFFDLLTPQDLGVALTEEMMMEPEASVSALVFHHPDCTYFHV